MGVHDLLSRLLQAPAETLRLSPRLWDVLVRQARRAGLLARLAETFDEAGLLDRTPDGPRTHLESARTLARAQHAQVRREVAWISQALRPIGVTPILLKGSAYLLAGLPAARGRVFSDIDILVPKARLPEVEAALMVQGWVTTHHSAYDQKYYRQWMHELPPMQHTVRDTVLDVHHTILPSTARLKPDVAKLFAAARDVAADDAGLRVLAPADMVLHSMTHLFHNEELSHALRDLSDLDLLLRHFATAAGFWPALIARARELDLARPLYYGLRHVHRLLATPVPTEALTAIAPDGPRWPLSRGMDVLWNRALRPAHASAADRWTAPSLWLLYVRAHWLRMPPPLLARHLAIKAWGRQFGDESAR